MNDQQTTSHSQSKNRSTERRGRYPRRFRRNGNVICMTAVLMVFLFALVAFALDLGMVFRAKTELQRSADSAALAAAYHLSDRKAAAQAAMDAVNENPNGAENTISNEDIEFGYWDRSQGTFNVRTARYSTVNAVRVTLKRTEATGNPVSMVFARLMGIDTKDVQASATAMYDNQLCGPFIGIDEVRVPGSPATDSYSSLEGEYDPLTARDYGGVCSDGPATVSGNSSIRGSLRAGKGLDPTINGDPTITGSIGSRLRPLNLPPVDATNARQHNNNSRLPLIRQGNREYSPLSPSGDFSLQANESYRLPRGTYYFRSMSLAGQSTLNIDGQTFIYLTGNLSRTGGVTVNNNTKVPSNLQFFMTGGNAKVTSTNPFHGTIYGPNTDITLSGDADLFGVIVGKTLKITGNSTAHYDEALELREIEFPRRVSLVD